jgi:hypothetical protein
VKAEDVQANDSHRRVAQQEILRNQDWGDTWLWTYGICTKASMTGNSHGKMGCVTNSPFWPCFWPSTSFFLAPSSRDIQSHSARNNKNTIKQDDSLVLITTRRRNYLLNGRRRPRDLPSTPGPHHVPDHPPPPQHTPEMESTGQPKTAEGSEERTPQGSPPTCG